MNLIAVTLLSLYFLFLLYFSLTKRKTLSNSYINLLKPLFPSWKFFDYYEESNLLFYRIGDHENISGEWSKVYTLPETKVTNLLINPNGNLILAIQSHLGQLIYDIDHAEAEQPFFENLSYKITKNAIEYYLRKNFSHLAFYQFKLATVNHNGEAVHDLLISPVYHLPAGKTL